jgi:serine/threonine-protein kinase
VGDPGNSDLAWARGLVERRLGQWEQATADLRRAVELDPRSSIKNLDLFELYARRRDYAAAERYVNRALELEPESPGSLFKAFLILARDGDFEAAARTLDAGVSRAGVEDIVPWAQHTDLGAALWANLDSTARAAVDRLSLDRFGTDTSAYYLAKARARRHRGDAPAGKVYFDSAAAVLEGRVRARPDDPALVSALGYAYAGAGRRERAMRLGQRAVALRPLSKDTWYGVDMVRNLAVVYALLGEADSTVKQLRILLSVPSWISIPSLRADPTWDPIREDPGFRALLERGE